MRKVERREREGGGMGGGVRSAVGWRFVENLRVGGREGWGGKMDGEQKVKRTFSLMNCFVQQQAFLHVREQ